MQCIVTANHRLALYLQERNKQQAAIIMPLQEWLASIYLPEKCTLLNETQELAVWEKIINDSAQANVLLRTHATAQMARQAWQLLKQWQLPLATISKNASEDTQAFYEWANQFNALCHNNHWLDQSSFINLFISEIAQHTHKLPKAISCVGFEFITPQLHALFTKLQSLCSVNFSKLTVENSSSKQIALTHQEHEIYIMARWASQLMRDNPDYRVACVIANLNQIRKPVERIFTEVFTPKAILPDATAAMPAFNISGGMSLNEFPLIFTALQLLELARDEFALTTLSHILRSPFISGADSEFNQRAALDFALYKLGEQTLSIRSLLAVARTAQHNKLTHAYCPIFIKKLESYLSLLAKHQSSRSPQEWSRLFSQLLLIMNWPGDRTLNSYEYQTQQRWQSLLDEFQHLTFLYPQLNYAEALSKLISLTRNTIFQPQTPMTGVHIMTPLETVGLNFDYMWIMGFNDINWPASSSPNPFLPTRLQRSLNMPHASAEQELAYAHQLMHYFTQSTQSIIYSYALKNQDQLLRPSALLSGIETVNSTDLPLANYTSLAEQIYASALLETVIDNQAPKVNQQELIRGGTGIFRKQAACPFRAFAEIRLGADTLPNLQLGLNLQERGQLVHDILATLWRQLDNQQNLCNYSEAELNDFILQNIDVALVNAIQHRPLTLKNRFMRIERQRLLHILQKWLNIEKQRPPFQVIQQEQWRQAIIGEIPINMQIDRIDELADGSHIIIDYKTGECRIEDWLDERLEEPQLPLYCITSDKPVAGLVFAQVKINNMGFKGLAEESYKVPGAKTLQQINNPNLPPTWQGLQQRWYDLLLKLSYDFRDGKAEVNPKDPQKTCQYCSLGSLCRIDGTVMMSDTEKKP
jgi:ATP-dependent helicase/nuclease subunit B